jgi:hypothetical protein
MRKRVDKNDATQEVSASMLVPDKKPPVYPNLPKNDASMWMQAPVSAEDFVGAATKKPTAPRSGRPVLLAGMLIMLVAVTGAGVWYAFLREPPPSAAAYETKPPAPATPAVAATPVDAAVAVAAPDAAAVVAVDAGVPVVAALQADAISGADPAHKKTPTKKRPLTKKVTKKKTAAAPKKKR